MHIPFHHKRATKLVSRVMLALKPEMVLFLGDVVDFYSISRYGKDPSIVSLLKQELEAVNQSLDWIDEKLPYAKKVFLEGNHCARLESYICEKAPALFGITEVKLLLKINTRPGWTFVPYGPNQRYQILNSSLYARHEPLGSTAKQSAQRSMCNLVYGHIHRSESAYAVGLDGQQFINFSPGWLGDSRHDQVFSYVKNHHQWQLGFSVIHITDDGTFYPQIIPIRDDMTCVVNGTKFSL